MPTDDLRIVDDHGDAARAASPLPPALLDLERRHGRTQRLAALGALVARLAHELGTPLHSIAGHLDLILDDPTTPPTTRHRLEVVSGEVRRLSRLIRRYLEHLRTPQPSPTPTDLRSVVLDVLDALEPTLTRTGVQLELDFAPGVEAPIACDRDQIEQLIVNLVQNAVDAMPAGGELTVRLDHADTGRALSVCDEGSGIAAEVREHVFEPFFTTKGGGRGSGLGLAICREIARAHGGEVQLASKAGIGTVVTVTLMPLTTSRGQA